MRWLLLLVPLAALTVSAGTLWQHHTLHVTSRNAAIRGKLSEIGSRVRGVVARVLVDVGDQVAAGDILVELDHRHLAAEVAEARAAVAALVKRLEVERVRIDLQGSELERLRLEAASRQTAAEAKTETARLRSVDQKRILDMNRELYEGSDERGGVISGNELEEAEFRWRTAAAELAEVRARELVVIQTGEQSIRAAHDGVQIRRHEVEVLEADLAAARARLARAQAEVESSLVRAPAAGSVVRLDVHPGGSVDLGQSMLSLWLGDELWLEAWIDESDLGDVRVGTTAFVTLPSHPEREFRGVVERIGLATDLELPQEDVPQPRFTRMRGTPVVGLRVRLSDRPATLVPGLTAEIAIPRASRDNEGTTDPGR